MSSVKPAACSSHSSVWLNLPFIPSSQRKEEKAALDTHDYCLSLRAVTHRFQQRSNISNHCWPRSLTSASDRDQVLRNVELTY